MFVRTESSDLAFKANYNTIPTGSDFNTLTSAGLYFVEIGCSNGVSGDPHFAIIISGGYRVVQIGITITNVHAYVRTGVQGSGGYTWTTWKEFSIS